MTKFNPTALLGLATAGLLAGAAPAVAAPMFDTAAPSSVSGAADQVAHQYRDRGYREDRGYRNYNGNRGYNGASWRGRDGRYYCRRNDGTTGLLIGGAAGGLIGHSIAGRGGDRTLGTILGVAGGALLGREVDRSGSRGSCR
ncbi:glycine zipper 2TM domain-containing protein [Novosphingobium sp. G106]|uniref:glycine zipper 2TM domain-containing protein n=1 Tax=Novosphingobium sp. G106 TaxID=2849500 RepID=UPI0020C351E0|nr:glycine zipper 2TM domain-containing protein [Novosphingobium sp. G106]